MRLVAYLLSILSFRHKVCSNSPPAMMHPSTRLADCSLFVLSRLLSVAQCSSRTTSSQSNLRREARKVYLNKRGLRGGLDDVAASPSERSFLATTAGKSRYAENLVSLRVHDS